jgi:hypothetical protein
VTKVVIVPSLVLGMAWPAAAQTSHHVFTDLGRYIDAGDSIHVVTKTDGQVIGELDTLTSESVRVTKADGTTREIAASEVGWIDRVPDPWWDGVVGGAVAGYAFTFGIGAVFCAAGDSVCGRTFGDPGAHRTALKIAGLWAAGFGLVDLSQRDQWLVYGRRPGDARGQLRARPRAASLSELWSTVRPDDRVVVRRGDGSRVEGRFQSASSASVRVRVAERVVEMPASQVRQVTRRTSWIREGMLIGPGVGAAIGGLNPPQGASRGDGVVTGALGGWAFGTVIGMVLPRQTTVFEAKPARSVTVGPEFTGHGYGVAAAVRF